MDFNSCSMHRHGRTVIAAVVVVAIIVTADAVII
jgi:hypothetical protein